MTARHRAISPLDPINRSTDSGDTLPHYHGFGWSGNWRQVG